MSDADRLIAEHLAALEDASPSTQRQRAWALRELAAYAAALGRPRAPLGRPGSLLDPELVHDWLDSAAAGAPPGLLPASLPGLRARASAVRALARHAEATGATAREVLDALTPVLRLPTPTPTAPPPASPVRHLLSLADPDAPLRGVLRPVWARFCAHAHLLALTGEREDVMATLPTTALTGTGSTPGTAATSTTGPATTTTRAGTTLTVTAGLNPRTWTLPGPARTALTGWLEQRATLVAPLRGGEPAALWVRARPSADRRTGAVRPAGLPLSDRGLRLAFTTTVHLLALGAPQVADVTTADLRRHARTTAP